MEPRDGSVPPGIAPEMPGRPREDVVGLDVAHDHERGVVRDVVQAVVAVEIVSSHRPQIVEPADGRVPVGVRAEGRRRDLHVEHLFGIVFAALELGNDHGALGLAVFRLVESVRHALGFDEEHLVEGVPPRGLEVGGLVDPGVAVPHPAETLDDALHLFAGDVGRPLEVHVLDPMRHAGPSGHFVARPDSVPAPDGHERRGVDFLHQDLEAVGEGFLTHGGRSWHLERGHLWIISGYLEGNSGQKMAHFDRSQLILLPAGDLHP